MGTIAGDLLKLVARGHQDDENTWSFGIWLGVQPLAGINGTNIAALTAALEPPFSTYATFCANHVWSSMTQYEGITTYYYPGNSSHSSLVGTQDVTPIVGSQTGYLPAYVSMVQSLRSVFSTRSQRGRIYVPWSGGGLGSNGQCNQTLCDNMAAATAALITAINALSLSAHGVTSQDCVIASFTTSSTSPIDHVIVDSLPDVQKRRQDKIGAVAVGRHSV